MYFICALRAFTCPGQSIGVKGRHFMFVIIRLQSYLQLLCNLERSVLYFYFIHAGPLLRLSGALAFLNKHKRNPKLIGLPTLS